MRLFIAVKLSDEIKKEITDHTEKLRSASVKGRYVSSENYHITLAFLGEVKNARQVISAISSIAFSPFSLSLEKTGHFNDVLWVGLKKSRELYDLADCVRNSLSKAGIGYDKKRFNPHITVVRDASFIPEVMSDFKAKMTVDRFSLIKSEFINGKRIYTELCSFSAK